MSRLLRLDLYAFALGALALLSLVFLSTRNGAALVMCAIVFAGLLAGRAANFPDRALVPLAFGLVALLWIVWIDPPADSHRTSALAHFCGGALAGWALAEYLRPRSSWPLWAIAALAAVFGVTVLWEIAEIGADRLLDTALVPSARDSALDIFFGSLGGGAAVLLASLLAPLRPGR